VSGFVVWRTASSRRARSVTPGMVVESSRVVFLSVGRCAMCCDCEAGSSGVGRPTGDCHYKQGDRAACGRRRVFGCGLDALLCSSEIQISCTSSKEQGFPLLLLFYVRFVLATELLSRNKVAVSSNHNSSRKAEHGREQQSAAIQPQPAVRSFCLPAQAAERPAAGPMALVALSSARAVLASLAPRAASIRGRSAARRVGEE